MPRGIADINALRLSVLQNFVTKFKSPPENVLSALFGTSQSPSSSIEWESQTGNRGMAPFKAPGVASPATAPDGIAQHVAEAAFWGEKMFFGEEFLNNIRKEGTTSDYLSAEARLSRELAGLTSRNIRRKEWMFAKMIFDGSFDYAREGSYKASVDYSLPTANQVTLADANLWSTGTNKQIIENIMDGKQVVADANDGRANWAVCNSVVLKYMALDTGIQTLLQKSAFGSGDLFNGPVDGIINVNAQVMGNLLGIDNFIVYDQKYDVRAYLTGAVTADSTTAIPVSDVSDFEVGGTLRFIDVSAGTWEDETIESIQVEAGTVTVSTAPSTSYKAGEDRVIMTRGYVADDKFSIFASNVDGQPIAEFKEAPFGNARNYGITPDRWEKIDPDGIYIRVENKGLPILYHRDAIYNLTVA